MKQKRKFAWYRVKALSFKEFYLIMRDPVILVSAIFFPLLEVILFTVLFNVNPRHLQMSVLSGEETPMTRSLVQAFVNSKYYTINNYTITEKEADQLMSSGKSQFILQIPPGFSRDVIRGKHPNVLLVADGSNPLIVTGALSAVEGITNHALMHDLKGTLKSQQTSTPFNIIVQQRYNPTIIEKYYTVPCLVSIVLVLTMMMLSSLSIAKEKEEGTMESLLATPAQPIEVMLSKMFPYFLFGLFQFIIVLAITNLIFRVPFRGSILLILFCVSFVIIACLGIGLFFSAKTNNRSSAMQLTSQFFAINVLFSGFFFPFQGMPYWARLVGDALPITHFMRITLAIALKGSSFTEIWGDLWPIIVFMIVALVIGIKYYQQTLD